MSRGGSARLGLVAVNAEPEEIERLRARVARAGGRARASRRRARTRSSPKRSDGVYWLDRLQLDLDVTLGRPPVRFALLAALGAVRRARRLRGRVRRTLHR